jgi:glycosyltransferase involved in cell wall biosynthesis
MTASPADGISLIIPSRNESPVRLIRTIRAFARHRETANPLEAVVVDDASEKPLRLPRAVDGVPVRLIRSETRLGVGSARNLAAAHAEREILFGTDAHVTPSHGWDSQIAGSLGPRQVVAATIADERSGFRGFGCRLVVPFMGTHWVRERPSGAREVQIASSAGFAIRRSYFEELGGFDDGMILYGGYEPEFGLRVWLSGGSCVAASDLVIRHRFKTRASVDAWVAEHRSAMIHNSLRFGFSYMSNAACLQMLRHFSQIFPDHVEQAYAMLDLDGIFRRRRRLKRTLAHDFTWFARKFRLKNQAGGALIL